jgi:hypothetical protein
LPPSPGLAPCRRFAGEAAAPRASFRRFMARERTHEYRITSPNCHIPERGCACAPGIPEAQDVWFPERACSTQRDLFGPAFPSVCGLYGRCGEGSVPGPGASSAMPTGPASHGESPHRTHR